MTDFEKYLLEGRKQGLKDLEVVEAEIARLYKESLEQIDQQLKDFLAQGYDEEDVFKYGRLAKLKKGLAEEYQRMTGKVIPLAETSSADSYIEAFKKYEYALGQAGVMVDFGLPAVDAVRASVYSEQSGFDLIKTFNKNAQIRIPQLQGAITRGILQGKSYQETAKEVRSYFNKGFNDALRVVRTEEGRNWTEGQLKADNDAKALGIDTELVWMATLDRRTREAHGRLDGKVADKDGNFYMDGVTYKGPGVSNGGGETVINCRCTLTSRIKGVPEKYRRIKGEGMVKNVDFETWARAKGWTPETGWSKVQKI